MFSLDLMPGWGSRQVCQPPPPLALASPRHNPEFTTKMIAMLVSAFDGGPISRARAHFSRENMRSQALRSRFLRSARHAGASLQDGNRENWPKVMLNVPRGDLVVCEACGSILIRPRPHTLLMETVLTVGVVRHGVKRSF